ncbi:MAG: V-type ATP synthase subunit E family protein [Deinococcales bacterium]
MSDLAALLEKEASTEIESILSEARSRASEVVAEARQEADALVAQRERQAAAQRSAAVTRARSSAQLEASSLQLRAQHEGVEAVFEEARKRLSALVDDGDAYPAVLEKLLDEALETLDAQDVQAVVVHPDERAVAEAAVGELSLEASVETDEGIRGGVRLRLKGNNTVENSLFERLEVLRAELASEVSEGLFGASRER